jgi:hypothetical protein
MNKGPNNNTLKEKLPFSRFYGGLAVAVIILAFVLWYVPLGSPVVLQGSIVKVFPTPNYKPPSNLLYVKLSGENVVVRAVLTDNCTIGVQAKVQRTPTFFGQQYVLLGCLEN